MHSCLASLGLSRCLGCGAGRGGDFSGEPGGSQQGAATAGAGLGISVGASALLTLCLPAEDDCRGSAASGAGVPAGRHAEAHLLPQCRGAQGGRREDGPGGRAAPSPVPEAGLRECCLGSVSPPALFRPADHGQSHQGPSDQSVLLVCTGMSVGPCGWR